MSIAIAVAGTTPRRSFIDKEKDAESSTHNMGVLQLDEARFLSVDPLWEKYRSVTPYHYCMNDPVSLIDKTGEEPTKSLAGTIEVFMNTFTNTPSKIGNQVGVEAQRSLLRLGLTEWS